MISHVKHQNEVLPDYFKTYSSSTERKKKKGGGEEYFYLWSYNLGKAEIIKKTPTI